MATTGGSTMRGVWEFIHSGLGEAHRKCVTTIAESGLVTVVGDYGDFSLTFSEDERGGASTAMHLARLDVERVAVRMTGGRPVLDVHGSFAAARREVMRLRRTGRISRDAARGEWNILAVCEALNDWQRFRRLSTLALACEVYERSGSCLPFCREVLPIVTARILSSLHEE